MGDSGANPVYGLETKSVGMRKCISAHIPSALQAPAFPQASKSPHAEFWRQDIDAVRAIRAVAKLPVYGFGTWWTTPGSCSGTLARFPALKMESCDVVGTVE